MIVVKGEENVRNARILALRTMLKLEVKGMTRRGRSAYSIIKEEFSFKGSKKRVLEQLSKHIEEHILPASD